LSLILTFIHINTNNSGRYVNLNFFIEKIWLIHKNIVLLKLLGIFIVSVRNDGHPQKKFHNIYLTKWEFCFNFVKQLRWESQKKMSHRHLIISKNSFIFVGHYFESSFT
jgi:hypothetical protein